MEDPEVDQAGLFDSRDDFDLHPGSFPDQSQELVSVGGFSGRAGGHGPQVLSLIAGGDLGHTQDARHSSFDRICGEMFHVGGSMAEADHFLLASDHLKALGSSVAGHHHMETVGPDIESCDDPYAVFMGVPITGISVTGISVSKCFEVAHGHNLRSSAISPCWASTIEPARPWTSGIWARATANSAISRAPR